MKEKERRFLYGGIHERFRAKAAFMERIMKIDPMREVIAKNLSENGELVAKLCKAQGQVGDRIYMHFELREDELELIYDTLYEKNLQNMLVNADTSQKLYTRPLRTSEIICDIDVTCYVAYAIVMNPLCREKLCESVQERSEFYQYWEDSEYHCAENEIYLPAKDIWDFRLVIGMLVKMREEEDEGEMYHLLMRIIYAGNRARKRWLKGNEVVSVSSLQEMMKDEVEQSDNMLWIRAQMMVLFVMAEDLGIAIRWDYEWMVQTQFYQDFQCNGLQEVESLKESLEVVKSDVGDLSGDKDLVEANQDADNFDKRDLSGGTDLLVAKKAKTKAEHEAFLQKFDEKYASHCSLTQLAMNKSEDDIGILLMNLMALYQVHPRKFTACVLEEEECEALLNQSESWNQKKYRYLMMIANMCKYIQQLEMDYLTVCREKEILEDWKALQESSVEGDNQALELLKMQYEKEMNRLRFEKNKMTESISKQEMQISKMKKRLEQTETKMQENTQELSALRSYVYLMSEKEDELEQEPPECEWKKWVDFLKDRKVLVVGGHVNWQNKLKELFPKWQFITARQGAVVDKVIKGRDVIVCNTMMLDHSCYYKVVSAMGRRQKLCYVHSNNMKKCLGEIVAQVK